MYHTIVEPSPAVQWVPRSEFDRLLARVDALELQAQQARLGRQDLDRLAAFLPAVAGVKGSEWWLGAELLASEAPALRIVLVGLSGKGDILRVLVRSTPRITADGLRTEHEVLQVVEEFNAPRQIGGLLPPIGDEDDET